MSKSMFLMQADEWRQRMLAKLPDGAMWICGEESVCERDMEVEGEKKIEPAILQNM